MTTSGKSRHPKGAIIVLVVGALLFGAAKVYSDRTLWTPVRFSIGPESGIVRSPEFAVNLNRRYDVGIEVDKVIQSQTLNCLLG